MGSSPTEGAQVDQLGETVRDIKVGETRGKRAFFRMSCAGDDHVAMDQYL